MSVRQEIFDVTELQRISYTCPNCGTEFVFNAGKTITFEDWCRGVTESAGRCPICHQALGKDHQDHKEGVLLYEALVKYQDFYRYVQAHKDKLSLKLVILPAPNHEIYQK